MCVCAHPGRVLPQVAALVLDRVLVSDLREELHLLDDVLPLLQQQQQPISQQHSNSTRPILRPSLLCVPKTGAAPNRGDWREETAAKTSSPNSTVA